MNDIEKKLKEILALKDFNRLDEFAHPHIWAGMSIAEVNQLASLFVLRAEAALQEGSDEAACQACALAAKMAPRVTARLLYMRALDSVNDPLHIAYLTLAAKALEGATTTHPDCVDSWFFWGVLLSQRGKLYAESQCLEDAEEKFARAVAVYPATGGTHAISLAELYWRWGYCSMCSGDLNGEVADFAKAVERYTKAETAGAKGATFWVDFGDAMQALGFFLSRVDFLREAVRWYEKGLSESPHYFLGCYHLASAQKRIYEITNLPEDVLTANESFKHVAQLDVDQPTFWLQWGRMLFVAGRDNHDMDLIQQSVEKFEKAQSLMPNDLSPTAHLVEALLALGIYFERVDLLREAEAKIVSALSVEPHRSEWQYLYGACLTEQGRYFKEKTHYIKAIEHFQLGLVLEPVSPSLWYGLVMAYFAFGELEEHFDSLEKASNYCEKIFEFYKDREESCVHVWNEWGIILVKMAEIAHDAAYITAAVEKFELAINYKNSKDELPHIDPDWLYNYGCALDLMGDLTGDETCYERAVQILTKVIASDPKFAFARYNLAVALAHLGETTDDIECFCKALELFQQIIAQDHEDDLVWNEWGNTLLFFAELVDDPTDPEQASKLYAQAEDKFYRAIACGNQQAYYNLAGLYSLTGSYATAIHFLERAEASGTLPSLEELENDEWLANLREQPRFRQFIEQIQKKG